MVPRDIINVGSSSSSSIGGSLGVGTIVSRTALGTALDTVGVGGGGGVVGSLSVGGGVVGVNGSTLGHVKISTAYPDSGDMLADMLGSIQAAGTNIVLQGDWISAIYFSLYLESETACGTMRYDT